MAGVLIYRTLGRDERILHRPGLAERRRVVHGHTIKYRIGVRARKPLHHVQILGRPAEPRLIVEIGRIDNQRAALPMPHRIAQP